MAPAGPPPPAPGNVTLAPLTPANEAALLRLWREYQEFYRTSDIDEARNQAHVRLIRDTPATGCIHVAEQGAEALGFSTLYFSYASTRACRIAVLNDLYVIPARRGEGIGRALIEHALGVARREGVRYVRWSTEASNLAAQRLYRGYGEPTKWKVYSVDVTARVSKG